MINTQPPGRGAQVPAPVLNERPLSVCNPGHLASLSLSFPTCATGKGSVYFLQREASVGLHT